MRSALLLVLVAGCKISSADWKREMETEVPNAFCDPQQYFRQCFDVDEATCRSTVAELMPACFAKLQLPETMATGDGGKFGEKLGECIGGRYDDKLNSKHNANPKCTDPNNWK